MKRTHPTLKAAIEWIALNDNAGNNDSIDEIADYVTTCLIADLFGKTPESIALRIALLRTNEEIAVRTPGTKPIYNLKEKL